MNSSKETTDVLRGPKVNAKKHWDGENWILENAKTRKPLLIGPKDKILKSTTKSMKPLKTP